MSTPINAGQSFKSKVSEVEIFRNQKNSIDEIKKVIDTFNYIIHSTNKYSDIINKCEKVRKKLKFQDYISKAYLSPIIIDIVKESNELYYKNINIPTLYIIDEDDENIDVEYGIYKLKEFNNEFINIEVLKGLDHYLSSNNNKWKTYKESADREIDTLAANKIIDWVTQI